MISAILFDLDDTLLDFHKAERIALTKTLQRMGIAPEEPVLARYSGINKEHWERLERGELTREQVKVRRFTTLFSAIGVDADAVATAELYERLLGIGHYFIDGAPELLETLRGRYRMAIISNGTPEVQRGRLDSAGIRPYFEKIFISANIGADKPSPAFFQAVFDGMPGLVKEETVVVGDSMTGDILGGRNAGLRTVRFMRFADTRTYPYAPEAVITHLDELPALLARM